MAGQEETKDEVLAEKAYEAAAAKAPVEVPKPVPPAPKTESAKPISEIAEAAVEPKSVVAAPAPKAEPAPAVSKASPPDAPKAAKAKVVKAKPAKAPKPAVKVLAAAKPAKAPVAKVKAAPAAKIAAVAKPAAPKKVVPAKPVAAKPVIKAAKAKPVLVAATKPLAPKANAAKKTAETKTVKFAGLFTPFMLEEKTMDMSANFAGFQDAITEAQTKAKAAFEKSAVAFGEVGDFTKGNVEAVLESGKIFAEGLQGFGSEFVAEGRSAFETLTGDIKELAAAKSPNDFFKLQGDLARKNFDSAVAYGSKNSEAVLKLMSDVFAPLSGRVSLAVEKARQTAA
ncbi:phasin [Novosphingobium sp. ST904]|nr:phasin [Novosphingobium sp. ST904]TCM36907.1 hypothetical protein EDF59_113141 [Novosphingobium sp. ST904]